MIRVLLADDEPLVRLGIRAVLESTDEIEVVAEAADGRTAVDQALGYRPDVALIDINMPVLDGLSAAEQLRRQKPAPRVILLTSFGTEPNVLRALEHGADGFVLKNCEPDELIRAVRAVHRGDAYLSPAVTRLVVGLAAPASARRRREAAERLAGLTARETQILRLVADGLSNAEIGRRLGTSESTVKSYVSRTLSKLGCANRVQAALLVREAEAPQG
jgi:DNA-binding NarL/FixJ family response regulator